MKVVYDKKGLLDTYANPQFDMRCPRCKGKHISGRINPEDGEILVLICWDCNGYWANPEFQTEISNVPNLKMKRLLDDK